MLPLPMRSAAIFLGALLFSAAAEGCATTDASSKPAASGTTPARGKRPRAHPKRFTTNGDLHQQSSSDESARVNERSREKLENDFANARRETSREMDEAMYDRTLDTWSAPARTEAEREEREREAPPPTWPTPGVDDGPRDPTQ